MKKLNLKMKGIGEMLSKEQMKNVVGGNYSGQCGSTQAWSCRSCDAVAVVCSASNPNGLGPRYCAWVCTPI